MNYEIACLANYPFTPLLTCLLDLFLVVRIAYFLRQEHTTELSKICKYVWSAVFVVNDNNTLHSSGPT